MFFGRMVDDFFGRGTANLKSPWRLPLDIAMPDMLRGGPCRGDLFASFSPDDSKVGKIWERERWVDLSFFRSWSVLKGQDQAGTIKDGVYPPKKNANPT